MKLKPLIITGSLIIILSLGLFFTLYFSKVTKENKLVLDKIEQLQQLVTAKQIYREILYSKETKDFLWLPILNKEFLISLDFIITAGVDISKGYKIIKRGDIKVIILPKAEIISIDADDSSITEYFVKQRLSNLTHDDLMELIRETKETILISDNISSLLKDSENNAKEILKSLLQLANLNIDVEFSNDVVRELK